MTKEKYMEMAFGKMLKKIGLLIVLLCCLLHLNAQEQHNVKLGVEVGFLPLSEDSHNLGLFLKVEPKVKVLENTFIGLRFGLTLNSHSFENSNSFQFYIDESFDNAVLSFVPTIDYYFPINNFRPYIGAGVGYYLLPNPIEVYEVGSSNILAGSVKERIGFLVRGGLELHKFRFGLEYTFIPKADIEIPDSKIIGTVGNSYLGLSFGFIFGVGKN